MTFHAVAAAAESFMSKLRQVPNPEEPRIVVTGDRRALYCTHPCDCVNRCAQGCCFRTPINTTHPTILAYQRARFRDGVRLCGYKSGRLSCEYQDDDSHPRNAAGCKVHRRGQITWVRK
jgi:hypothetical protein